MKLTVLGSSGGIGQPLSLLLAMNLPADTELALYDISPINPGVAKDISHVPTSVRPKGYGKEQLEEALAGADVVLIPAGIPRKPGMTRADLINTNASIVGGLAKAVAKNCPKALLAVITNPVNSLVPMVSQVLRAEGTYDRNRLFGVTTLDTLRANTFVSELKKLPMGTDEKIEVRVIGGHSGETILPLLSQLNMTLSDAEVQELTQHIRNAGTEVVEAKAGAGSATLSMAAAAARFGQSLVRGLKGKANVVESTFVEDGEYAPFFARPVLLGPTGIQERLPIGPLSPFEQQSLEKSLPSLKQEIETGLTMKV